MTREEVLDLRNDRALKDAHWDGILSHEEVAMIREYRASGRKGVALLKYASHLSDDHMQKLIAMTKDAMGVSKVLVVPDGVEISRLV